LERDIMPINTLSPSSGVLPDGRSVSPGTTQTDALRVREFSARDLSARVTRSAEVVEALSRQYRILDTLREAANQLVVHRPCPSSSSSCSTCSSPPSRPARRHPAAEQGTSRLQLKASRSRTGLPFVSVSRAIADRVLEQGQALLLDDALRHPAFSSADSIINGGVRSALCAPLWFASGERDEVVGLVYLDNSSFGDAFDEEDLGLVTAIASVAAVKIHTTRLLQESRDNRRLKEEVRVAAEMQADLLPQTTPLLTGWSLAGGSRPCLAMGGDYYDWALGEDGLRLVLADVSGKGAAAAVLMAAVRALVRSRWAEADLAARRA
jgi:hypothetical protein